MSSTNIGAPCSVIFFSCGIFGSCNFICDRGPAFSSWFGCYICVPTSAAPLSTRPVFSYRTRAYLRHSSVKYFMRFIYRLLLFLLLLLFLFRFQWPRDPGRGSRQFGYRDRGFESLAKHGCFSSFFRVMLSCVNKRLATG